MATKKKKTPFENENRFLMTVAVAKRARQLSEGATPLIETTEDDTRTPLMIAIEEWKSNLLTVEIRDSQNEEDLLEEMSDIFDSEIEKEEAEEKKAKKTDKKSKGGSKPKSKSLVA